MQEIITIKQLPVLEEKFAEIGKNIDEKLEPPFADRPGNNIKIRSKFDRRKHAFAHIQPGHDAMNRGAK